ncbi:MAG: hypothetical protein EKK52_01325 [Burkholderiales bacterium]|nr:MAG: hypothetical protein EKK52_01325 [Burkholderiales bacterium]
MRETAAINITEAEARETCQRVLASPVFAKARLMGRLLRYLVDQSLAGDPRGTTEYAIGLEVLGRKAEDYNPGDDPTVRVQMGRLRRKLQAYEAQWAQPGEAVIRIPLGSYRPVFEPRRASSAAPAAAQRGTNDGADAVADALAMQPIQLIAGGAADQAFTQGLQEELLNQMVRAFGSVVIGEPHSRTLVSTLRIDPQRLRASVRLMEAPRQRVTWAQQFDLPRGSTIDEQEALAARICEALKQHLALP